MVKFDSLIQQSYAFDQHKFDHAPNWQLLRELFDMNFVHAKDKDFGIMPKKIHQVWLGSPIPTQFKKWGETWKRLNPTWEYKLWTDRDIDSLGGLNRILYDSRSNYGIKSDVVRYYILNQFGGIYVDTDFECIKSFDSLTYLNFLIGIAYHGDVEFYTGCTPKHPVMQRIVEGVNKITSSDLFKRTLDLTGSYFFTRNFFEVVTKSVNGVLALPPNYFYPCPNTAVGMAAEQKFDYVREESYALHHWAVSWKKDNRDWIQGDKFKGVADFVYAPSKPSGDDYDHLQNTFDVSQLKDGVNIVYTHTFYVKQLFEIIKNLKQKFVIITHNGDEDINSTYSLPDNVIRWYGQNVNVIDPRIESIPLGIENDRWQATRDRKAKIIAKTKEQRKYRNLVYMNHSVRTNPKERTVPYKVLAGKSWITVIDGSKPNGKVGCSYDEHVDHLYNHKFVISPEGNGIDTHRLWETLYLGSIPIEKRNTNNQFYTDLPILFVDKWEDVTFDLLAEAWSTIPTGKWNMEKLTFEYWKNKIINTK
jgi:mannosyltransferase OCH1-like enzyme